MDPSTAKELPKLSADLLQLRLILSFLQPLCGAVILLCFHRWLSRRQVKDWSLRWLILSLLSWIPPAVIQLAGWGGEHQRLISYIFSPVSNVLLTVTAFRLLRVKEVISRRGFQSWTTFVTWAVVGASVISELMLVSVLTGKAELSLAVVAMNIDAVTSSIAIISLGLCMSYSFYKYGNQTLMGLTLINFTYIMWYQFYLAGRGGVLPDNSILVAADITSGSFLTMLFIALVLAWGLSNASRLKFREFEPVNIVAMSIDLRGSTECTDKVWGKGDGEFIVNFKNKFCDWVMLLVSEAPYGTPIPKFTGDGLMLVWEVADASKIVNIADAVVGLGCALYGGYPSWLEKYGRLRDDAPKSIGIGVDFGYSSRLTTESGMYDYSGLPLDYASKLQGLARPDGGVVIQAKWTLPHELRSKFTKKGVLRIGNKGIPVRATGRVKFLSPNFDQQGTENMGLS
jgi:class 3 adenylate cyclase